MLQIQHHSSSVPTTDDAEVEDAGHGKHDPLLRRNKDFAATGAHETASIGCSIPEMVKVFEDAA
jgi:hypothetical protein